MISPGAIVTVRQYGAALWVVLRPASDGRAWHLRGKLVDYRGRSAFRGHIAGAGDITVIRDAPTYQVGDVVERNGLRHVVLRDLGDDGVELAVPEDRVPLKGGYTVRVPAGNTTVVSKSDLVLNSF
jgi:hypothetical protein